MKSNCLKRTFLVLNGFYGISVIKAEYTGPTGLPVTPWGELEEGGGWFTVVKTTFDCILAIHLGGEELKRGGHNKCVLDQVIILFPPCTVAVQ